jgi:dUTP pyrophosphatase
MQTVKFIKTDVTAKLPFKATASAACSDVYSVDNVIILPGETVLVDTGLKVAYIPEGFKIAVYDRSGFGAKSIHLGNGVGQVDEDYRGPLKVILYNANKPLPWYKKLFGKKDEGFKILHGDRIGQISLEKVHPVEYTFTDSFKETNRGEGGFGSTGIK